MSLSVLALGVTLLVVPRRYAALAVASEACAAVGFALAFDLVGVVLAGSGALVVVSTCALVVGVLALCEGLAVGLSFVPGEFRVTV